MAKAFFTKIINQELPAQVVAEDDSSLSLLDIMPLTMPYPVVPKRNWTISSPLICHAQAHIVFKESSGGHEKAVPR